MADHRYQSDAELLRRLKQNRLYQEGLRSRLVDLERECTRVRVQLQNAEQQAVWLVNYLSQPEAARCTAPANLGFSGQLPVMPINDDGPR